MPAAVANRYAKALASLAITQKDTRKVQQELDKFGALLRKNAELRQVLLSPAISLKKRKAVLGAVVSRLKLTKTSSNFFQILLDNFRMGILEEIATTFKRLSDERLGIVRVEVKAADPLTESQQKTLQKSFEKITSRKVELAVSHDPTLLGGMVARVGSTVYDGSLKNQLAQLSEQLVSGIGSGIG